MIGGIVIEVIVCPDRVWIRCEEQRSTSQCAIYVENTAKARSISEGDSLWWQGNWAMWTPYFATKKKPSEMKAGRHYDIKLKRIGFSGAQRPNLARECEEAIKEKV